MISKVGKLAVAAEYEKAVFTDEEAKDMRKSHLLKGLLGPILTAPAAATIAGFVTKNPKVGFWTGTGVAGLSFKHLHDATKSKKDFEDEENAYRKRKAWIKEKLFGKKQ